MLSRIINRLRRRLLRTQYGRRFDSRHRMHLAEGAQHGPAAALFQSISAIPGWFTFDDTVAFSLILDSQRALGIRGDILEIGSYHGRSTVVLAAHLAPGERLLVCDAFESETSDHYGNRPTAEKVRANVARIAGRAAADALDIYEGLSTSLTLPPDRRLRFAHVDGGHDEETVLHDIRLAYGHLVDGGVLALDDFQHPRWPGVSAGIERARAELPGLSVIGDFNRRGELGRKLYLMKARA